MPKTTPGPYRQRPTTMASLRNLALGALRLTGAGNIAQAIRHISRDVTRTLTVLDLTSWGRSGDFLQTTYRNIKRRFPLLR